MMILGELHQKKLIMLIIKVKRGKLDGLQNWIIILMVQRILKRRKMEMLLILRIKKVSVDIKYKELACEKIV